MVESLMEPLRCACSSAYAHKANHPEQRVKRHLPSGPSVNVVIRRLPQQTLGSLLHIPSFGNSDERAMQRFHYSAVLMLITLLSC